jgi:uncharacterized protein YehS (DUF1456 family)
MNNNETLRLLRKLLAANETATAEIFALGEATLDVEQVRALLKHDNDVGFAACDDETLARFMEGLVIQRRGRRELDAPLTLEWPLDNNRLLKKLRAAFELRDDDMHALLAESDQDLSKQALSSLFRSPGHKNFQPCSDQLLRAFIKGLTGRVRPR